MNGVILRFLGGFFDGGKEVVHLREERIGEHVFRQFFGPSSSGQPRNYRYVSESRWRGQPVLTMVPVQTRGSA